MTCPVCGGKTKVRDSVADCESVTRKRQCLDCGYSFKTIELETDLREKAEKQEGAR